MDDDSLIEYVARAIYASQYSGCREFSTYAQTQKWLKKAKAAILAIDEYRNKESDMICPTCGNDRTGCINWKLSECPFCNAKKIDNAHKDSDNGQ